MANVNKVMLIGRLTRDPEMRSFANGGRVAAFGFAVNNRKKNSQTGEWEDDPVFLDCEAFNRGDTGKLADTIEKYLKKGSQAFLEGHLKLDRWDDKTTGEKRQKLKVVVDVMQILDTRPAGDGSRQPARAGAMASAAPAGNGHDEGPPPMDEPPPANGSGSGDNIPF